MRLFSYFRSSASYRVRIVLAHKQLAYEYVPVNIQAEARDQDSAEFRGRNPIGQVPVLELEDEAGPLRLAQSVAICEYIEERWPTPPLLPSSPRQRAYVRQLVEIVNSGIQPHQNTGVLRQLQLQAPTVVAEAWPRHFVSEGLSALERLAKDNAGPFLAGPEVTLADVYLVPQLFAARRLEVPLTAYPSLLRAEEAASKLESFRVAHPSLQPDAPERTTQRA